MTTKIILGVVYKLTADEGMVLTTWHEGVDIIFYEGYKVVSTNKKGAKLFREITEEEHAQLMERQAIVLAQLKELYDLEQQEQGQEEP